MKTLLRRLALETYGRMVDIPMPSTPPGRILLIRPDHLGDILLAAPAIGALRRSLPRARVSLMVGPWSLETARRSTDVDEILTCPFPGFDRQRRGSGLWPYTLLRREAALLRGRFDLAVVLRPDHWWGALLATAARVPRRVGADTPETSPLLTNALPLKRRLHAVEQNRLLISAAVGIAGGEPVEPLPAVPAAVRIDAEDRAWAARETAALPGTGPLVLIHPGSGSDLKAWPADRWAHVADALAASGARVLLSGGLGEIGAVDAIQRRMTQPGASMAGQTRMGQLAAILARCALAVGADNGPLHLAAGLGIPTVRLYGPSDPAIFGPPLDGHQILTTPLPCRPCGNLVDPPCGAHIYPPCMLGIRPEAVVETAQVALASR